jgi:hypothetical protein
MTVSSGFFNSSSGDRTYNAEDMGKLFDGVIVDGIFTTVGEAFNVTPGTGLAVQVASGRAWFIRSWLYNDGPIQLTLNGADPSLPRKDAVYLDFNTTLDIRNNTIKVRTGTPAGAPQPPTMTVEEDHVEIPIAYITVNAGATSISQGNINYVVGDEGSPFASGLLTQLNASQLLAQWDDQFYDWFNNLQDVLDEGAETTIVNQLNTLNDAVLTIPPRKGRNLIENSSLLSYQRGQDTTYTLADGSLFDGPLSIDRWRGYVRDTVIDHFFRRWNGTVRVETRVDNPTPHASKLIQIKQSLDGYQVKDFNFGSPDARGGWLSFDFSSSVSGLYNVRMQNVSTGHTMRWSFNYTAPSVQRYNLYVPPPSNVSNTLPTVLRDHAVSVIFDIVCGDTFLDPGNTPSGDWDVVTYPDWYVDSNDFGLSDGDWAAVGKVQLEVGEVATPYETQTLEEALYQARNRIIRYVNYPTIFRKQGLSDVIAYIPYLPGWKYIDNLNAVISEESCVFVNGMVEYPGTGGSTVVQSDVVDNIAWPHPFIFFKQRYTGQAYEGLTNVGYVSLLLDDDI